MEERRVKLENAYFKNVLYVIEVALGRIPDPAHVVEKPVSKTITRYIFKEPIRTESYEKQSGRISVTYSQTKLSEFGMMAGIVFEEEPIVFECFQEGDRTVVVKGFYTTNPESTSWIKPIFDEVWGKLRENFQA